MLPRAFVRRLRLIRQVLHRSPYLSLSEASASQFLLPHQAIETAFQKKYGLSPSRTRYKHARKHHKSLPKSSPRPTPSLCDTPPGVQPVSASEIDIGDTSGPRIALTFDAGEPSEPTALILDILVKYHLHVTFFVTGEWANQNPDLVRHIHADGCEIGNHTMHHLDLRTLTDLQVCSELTQASQVIANLTGVTAPRPYSRPPSG